MDHNDNLNNQNFTRSLLAPRLKRSTEHLSKAIKLSKHRPSFGESEDDSDCDLFMGQQQTYRLQEPSQDVSINRLSDTEATTFSNPTGLNHGGSLFPGSEYDEDEDKTIQCHVNRDRVGSDSSVTIGSVTQKSGGVIVGTSPKPNSVHQTRVSPTPEHVILAEHVRVPDTQHHGAAAQMSELAQLQDLLSQLESQKWTFPLADPPFLRDSPPSSPPPTQSPPQFYDPPHIMAALSDGISVPNASDTLNNPPGFSSNMTSSSPPANSSDSDLNSIPDSASGYPFLRALHSFDATTLFSSANDEDPSSVCLSFVEAELVLLHSIHPSGWGDATILATGARGWIPTNYFTPYSEPKVVPVLSAVLNFVLAPKSHPLPKPNDTSYTFSPAAISAIVAGVRSLLEACGALTRDTPIVRKSPSIRKFRKILLAELAILVSLAKQYKYTTDDADIARLVAGSYKIIFRAVVFLDIWSMGLSNGDPDDHENIIMSSDHIPDNNNNNAINTTNIDNHDDNHNTGSAIPMSPSIDNIRARFSEDHNLPPSSSTTLGSDPSVTSSLPLTSPTAVAPPISTSKTSNRDSVIFHRTPPYALQRLDEVNGALNLYLGNFLHRTTTLDSDPTACTQILVNTRKSMLACRELLAAVEAISSRFLPRNKDLEFCKDQLFGKIRALVTAARDVVASTPSSNENMPSSSKKDANESDVAETDPLAGDDDTMTFYKKKPDDHAVFEREIKRLVDIAVECANTSGECVVRCRQIIELVGDFQLSAQREYPDFSDGIGATDLHNDEHPFGISGTPSANNSSNAVNAVSGSAAATNGEDTVYKYSDSNDKNDYTLVSSFNLSGKDGKNANVLPRIPMISPLIPLSTESETESSTETNKNVSSNNSDKKSHENPSQDDQLSPLVKKRNHNHSHTLSQPSSSYANSLVSANTTAPLPGAESEALDPSSDGKRLRSSSAPNSGNNSSDSVPDEPENEVQSDEYSKAIARNAKIQRLIDQLALEDRILREETTDRVRAGTLQSFVKVMTDDSTADEADPGFVSAFFLTFRQFSNAEELLSALIDRFLLGTSILTNVSGNNNSLLLSSRSTDPASRRRAKVYNILKRWMESHWHQSTDGSVLPKILEFANTELVKYQPASAKPMVVDLATRLVRHKDGVPLAPRVISVPGAKDIRRDAVAYANSTPIVSLVSRHQVALLVKAVESLESEKEAGAHDESSTLSLLPTSTQATNGKASLSSLDTASTNQTAITSSSLLSGTTATENGAAGHDTDDREKPLPPPPSASNSGSNLSSMASSAGTSLSGSAWTQSLRLVRNNALGIGHPVISLLDIDAYELAKQLTLLDSELMAQIRAEELLDNNFSMKKRHLNLAPHVSAMALFTNQLSSFVSDSLLVTEMPAKTRQKLLKHWVKIAEKCHELHNYNSLMTVVSALQSVNIKRLRKTWEGLPQRHAIMFQKLKTLMSIEKNYSNYRAELRGSPIPCVPYLGLYLTDLTFNSEGNHPLRVLTVDPATRQIVPAVGKNNKLAMMMGMGFVMTNAASKNAVPALPSLMGTMSANTTPPAPDALPSTQKSTFNPRQPLPTSTRHKPQSSSSPSPSLPPPPPPPPPPTFSVTNFDRYDRAARIIGELQAFQCVPYRVVACPELQAWLRAELHRAHTTVAADTNGLWKRSNAVEPKV